MKEANDPLGEESILLMVARAGAGRGGSFDAIAGSDVRVGHTER